MARTNIVVESSVEASPAVLSSREDGTGNVFTREEVREAPYPKAAYAWFVVVCLQLAYAVALIDRQILALLVQPIRRDLGLTDTQFSLLVGIAFVFFYSSMGLFCGRLADTKNRRNMIVAGMILWSIATGLCGIARNFTELFIARMLVGVGEAVLSPAAYSMIADYFPKEKRARAAAAYSMAISLGNGAALLVGGATVAALAQHEGIVVPVLGELRSWQGVLLLAAIPGIVVAAMMMLVREPARREVSQQSTTFGDAMAFVRSRASTLTLIVLSFALNGLITYCMATWIAATFIRNFGWTVSQIAAAQGTILVTFGTLGIFAGGWFVGRAGSRVTNATVLVTSRNALLALPVFALLVGFAPEPWMRLVGLAGVAFLGGFPSGLAPVAIFHMTPNQFRGQVTAIYLMTGTLVGLGIGVTMVAAVADYIFRSEVAIGMALGIVVAVAALLSATMLSIASKRPDRDFVASMPTEPSS